MCWSIVIHRLYGGPYQVTEGGEFLRIRRVKSEWFFRLDNHPRVELTTAEDYACTDMRVAREDGF